VPQYYIWTIGCQMNKAESERIGSYLEETGYRPAANADQADLIVVNSCVVRQNAENKVINRLNLFKSRQKQGYHPTLAVTGCLVNSRTDQLKERFPHVDYFFKPGDYPPWLKNEDRQAAILPRYPSPSTFVPIIQGCDNFCTYCIVPYRRGRERSRPMAEIVSEVEELARRGVKEVTLLGQNVDSYGHDLPDKADLADLLGELDSIPGLARIRFLTNHPKDMSPRLIQAVASRDKVCEHITLPVQSGSDKILKAMGRGYTAAHYRQLVSQIRRRIPGVSLSTDVIVGFPAESPDDFRQTFELLSELRFDTVHVAAYSLRPGTYAAVNYPDNVPTAEKKARLAEVEQLQERIAGENNAQLLGKTVEVLVEGEKGGKRQGRTRTDKLVFFRDSGAGPGELRKIRIERTGPWSLQGKVEAK
jgi:tRNA-2-methylthio-N6-dimethylallyladenosine synthase